MVTVADVPLSVKAPRVSVTPPLGENVGLPSRLPAPRVKLPPDPVTVSVLPPMLSVPIETLAAFWMSSVELAVTVTGLE